MPRRPLLLFESANDLHVCKNLCRHYAVPEETFEYDQRNGVTGVFETAHPYTPYTVPRNGSRIT